MICYMITCKVNGKRYIGITHGSAEKRLQRHLTASRDLKEQTKLARAIRKYGRENFTTKALYEAVDWRELCAVERGLIAQYAPEYNITKGGEGSSWTPDRKLEKSIKYKKRMLEDPEYAARINGLAKIGWTGEHREKRLAAQRSPERVEKTREQVKAQWLNPEYRKRCSRKNITVEQRIKHSSLVKDLWKDSDWRAKSVEIQKKSWTPERRAAQRARHAVQFSDPARRVLASEKQKAYNQKCILNAGWLLFVINKFGKEIING